MKSRKSITFWLIFLCLFSNLPTVQGTAPNIPFHNKQLNNNSDLPGLLIVWKVDGKLKKRIEIGQEIAFWTTGSRRKIKGTLNDIMANSLLINDTEYRLEDITTISPGRAQRGARFVSWLGVAASLFVGYIVGVLIYYFSGASTFNTLLACSPFAFLAFLSLRSPRKFSRNRFDFIKGETGS